MVWPDNTRMRYNSKQIIRQIQLICQECDCGGCTAQHIPRKWPVNTVQIGLNQVELARAKELSDWGSQVTISLIARSPNKVRLEWEFLTTTMPVKSASQTSHRAIQSIPEPFITQQHCWILQTIRTNITVSFDEQLRSVSRKYLIKHTTSRALAWLQRVSTTIALAQDSESFKWTAKLLININDEQVYGHDHLCSESTQASVIVAMFDISQIHLVDDSSHDVPALADSQLVRCLGPNPLSQTVPLNRLLWPSPFVIVDHLCDNIYLSSSQLNLQSDWNRMFGHQLSRRGRAIARMRKSVQLVFPRTTTCSSLDALFQPSWFPARIIPYHDHTMTRNTGVHIWNSSFTLSRKSPHITTAVTRIVMPVSSSFVPHEVKDDALPCTVSRVGRA